MSITSFLAAVSGVTGLFRAVLEPRRFFEDTLRRIAGPEVRLAVKAAFFFAASVTAGFTGFLLTGAIVSVQVIREAGPWAFTTLAEALARAALASALVPVLFAALDSMAMYLAAALAGARPRLSSYLLVRAGSMLPYTLKPPLKALTGGPEALTLRRLYALNPADPLTLAVSLAGTALTAYGLVKSLDMNPRQAAVAALAPLLLHILVHYAP